MRKGFLRKILAFTISGTILLFPVNFVNNVDTTFAAPQKNGRIKASSVNIRSGAGTDYSKVGILKRDALVTILEEVSGKDGNSWYKINFLKNSNYEVGYISKRYVRTDTNYTIDNNFERQLNEQGFPESYKVKLRQVHSEYPNWVFKAKHINMDWQDVIYNQSVIGRNLVHKNSISSWKSTADGAYNWDTSSWPGFDSSAWVAASEEIIKYYIDPRNFLDSDYIFQFLHQGYDESLHNAAGLESLLKGTFMESKLSSGVSAFTINNSIKLEPGEIRLGVSPEGIKSTVKLEAPGLSSNNVTVGPSGSSTKNKASDTRVSSPLDSGRNSSGSLANTTDSTKGPGVNIIGPGADASDDTANPNINIDVVGGTYADIIMRAGKQSGVNPYVLASMIIQEQGTKGSSGLISGNTAPYTGHYNFFNIGAYQAGNQTATQRGLAWAAKSGSYGRPWNSIEKAIIGGAVYYGDNYVKAGQDTLYLKKYNVQGSNPHKHQYMTNVQGAASEGYKLGSAYSDEIKAGKLVFYIPVFKNMPDTPQSYPSTDGSPNNKLSGLGVEGYSITPTFNRDRYEYDLIVNSNVSDIKIWANKIDNKANVSGIGNINLSNGTNTVEIKVEAENKSVRTYKLNIIRQENAPSYSDNKGLNTNSSENMAKQPGVISIGPGM